MKNFIEVNGVEEGSKYLVNINNIAKVYPINDDDKKVIDSVYKDDKWNMLLEFIGDDDIKSKLDQTLDNITKAKTVIVLVNVGEKSDGNTYTTETFDEIKVKIENALC